MRIIAGRARGHRLAVPPGKGTRPTSDRTREGLFSAVLASEGPLAGRRFLDLYAGSGAVGLEAWSRGAAEVLLVEDDARAARVAAGNVAALGATAEVAVRTSTVDRLGRERSPVTYDVVFADPPYDLPVLRLTDALRALHVRGWVADDALVVVERASRDAPFDWPGWVEPLRSRAYGEGTLWYGRVAEAAPVTEPPHEKET